MLQDHANPRARPAWQSLRILTFYRVLLAGLVLLLYLLLADSNPFGVDHRQLFRTTLLVWFAFSIAAGFSTRLQWPGFYLQSLVQVLTDIVAIAVLMYASGGISSSLSALLIIAVVAGALILPGRLAYLFAAAGTLALLATTGLATLSLETTGAGDLTRAGLFGVVLFITAALGHALSLRIRESEALATQRGIDLADLQQLNQYVVGQLQAGILVIDDRYRIRLANNTARTLLGLAGDTDQMSLQAARPDLYQRLLNWQQGQGSNGTLTSKVSGITLMPRFSRVKTGAADGALVLLEDNSQLEQQARQNKLASLGRLTASIAHEIRNPLGAISHAAQLLEESDSLDSADRRLTDIISRHCRRVDVIIESVLQLSRRSKTNPSDLVLDEWLSQFQENFAHLDESAARQLLLHVEPPGLLVRVDPAHLDQVLTNLCENAFRHAGQDAQVSLRAGRTDIGEIFIEVIDNGPGIPDDTVEQIFEPFFTTAGSGTGLGLYIARELCEINSARLDYEKPDSGGSCFRILFAPQKN